MGLQSNLHFWRDHKGHEIDVLFEKSNRTVPLEIKSGQTLNSSFFKGLDYWAEVQQDRESGFMAGIRRGEGTVQAEYQSNQLDGSS